MRQPVPRLAAGLAMALGVCLALVHAGTTPIHIDIEKGGNVDAGTASQWDGTFENVNGAFFWNGSRWVTNATAAHAYFTDLRTGQRLYPHTLHAVDASPAALGPVTGVPVGFVITKSLYAYTAKGTAPGVSFRYSAVRYDVLQPDGTTVILLSRGTGNGTAKGYLDAYIEEGKGSTTAVLGDPVLYQFPGMSAAEAILQAPDPDGANVRADLPTCTPPDRAQYWLDINGGSDMGGVSYHFHTLCLSPVQTEHWGASFAVDFQIEFTDAQGQIQDIRFQPALGGEGPGGPHLRRRLPGRRVS